MINFIQKIKLLYEFYIENGAEPADTFQMLLVGQRDKIVVADVRENSRGDDAILCCQSTLPLKATAVAMKR